MIYIDQLNSLSAMEFIKAPMLLARTHPGKNHTPIVRRPMSHDPEATDQTRGDEDRSWHEGRSGHYEDGPPPRMEATFDGVHRVARARTKRVRGCALVESVLKLWPVAIAMPCSEHWVFG